MKWYEGAGGRKFILTLLVLIGVAVCIYSNTKPDKDLLDFLKWALGMYYGANVTAGAAQALISKGKADQPDATQLQALVTGLQTSIDQFKAALTKPPSST
jgi:hypothetical protein